MEFESKANIESDVEQIGVFLVEGDRHFPDVPIDVRRLVHFVLLDEALIFLRCFERIERRVVVQMHQRAFVEIERRFHRLKAEAAAHHGGRTYVSWSWIDED